MLGLHVKGDEVVDLSGIAHDYLSEKIVIIVLRLVSNCSNEPGMWNFGSFV